MKIIGHRICTRYWEDWYSEQKANKKSSDLGAFNRDWQLLGGPPWYHFLSGVAMRKEK